MHPSRPAIFLIVIACAASVNLVVALPVPQPVSAPIEILVDAADAPRGIFHAELRFPVLPGPLTLLYPKWIPGEHSPSGPILHLAGLTFTASGKPIRWTRDKRDMFMFHLEVPEDCTLLNVSLDYLSPSKIIGPGYGGSPNATAHLLILLWNHVALYPQGFRSDDLRYTARLRIPAGWKYATTLAVDATDRDWIHFKTTSLTSLVDSPVMAGEYFRSVILAPGAASSITLDMVADEPGALLVDTVLLAHYGNLAAESDALFGARHYRHYHFLVSMSDALDVNGIEHHECTDIRVPVNAYTSRPSVTRRSYLLVHEFLHSWNGKFRRPKGLATADYNESMEGDLLWVYEGLTRYLDFVLCSRTQVRTPEEAREYLAWVSALLDHDRPGRSWRSLLDTQVSAQILYDAPTEWTTVRRDAIDFYHEGLLIWLEVDALLREKSGDRKSLDDFCKMFYAGPNAPPLVESYTIDDVTKTLSAVVPNDWPEFFAERLNSTDAHAPLGGLRKSGWTLAYSDVPNTLLAAKEEVDQTIDMSFSLGMWVDKNGFVTDVVPGSPAFNNGLGPGMQIVGVNGAGWSNAQIRRALAQSIDPKTSIELRINHGGKIEERRIDYHQGEKYPHLLREPSRPDRLSRLLTPLSSPAGR